MARADFDTLSRILVTCFYENMAETQYISGLHSIKVVVRINADVSKQPGGAEVRWISVLMLATHHQDRAFILQQGFKRNNLRYDAGAAPE